MDRVCRESSSRTRVKGDQSTCKMRTEGRRGSLPGMRGVMSWSDTVYHLRTCQKDMYYTVTGTKKRGRQKYYRFWYDPTRLLVLLMTSTRRWVKTSENSGEGKRCKGSPIRVPVPPMTSKVVE